jgi:hypothetical protein
MTTLDETLADLAKTQQANPNNNWINREVAADNKAQSLATDAKEQAAKDIAAAKALPAQPYFDPKNPMEMAPPQAPYKPGDTIDNSNGMRALAQKGGWIPPINTAKSPTSPTQFTGAGVPGAVALSPEQQRLKEDVATRGKVGETYEQGIKTVQKQQELMHAGEKAA